ncbi:MFS transporter [Paenibacillus jilunlii]|uniref:MFS transporter, DHA1 family, multidrug resistance protein n=1 Tax=Paenibacillus jilunlii TaxID=682956 RepID=A0A1G9XTV0_9BACL|nr:MFS transporter [Paenibacillus jilunlii]KWX79726.1 multidrug transporter [Paenibacillus jilunlii]SDM99673.1 MFS transporter, DHA1 family, multidrug resistance protein [Paenibacillus jilunlii]
MTLLLRNRGAMLLLMLNIFLAFTGIGLVVPIMPTYMNELGIGGSIVGLLVAAFSLTQLILSPFAGGVSDRVGRKKIIVGGLVVFALSELLFGLAESSWLLFASRMLGGAGAAMIMPAVMAYVADTTSMEERAKGMGLINAAITTGFIIGPGLGGYLAELGIRVPFFAAAGAAAFVAVVTFAVLPESRSSAELGAAKSIQENKDSKDSLITQLVRSYREPYFFGLLIVFVLSFGLANYETVFGLFVDHKFGFTPKDIAFVITFGSISGAVIQVTAFSWILNRCGENKVISASLLVSGLSIFLTLFVHGYWAIVTVTFIVFLAMDILRPAVGTQLSKMATESQQGFVMGMNSAYTSLGNIAGPIVAGVLFDLDINFPYAVAALVLMLCFLLSLGSRKRMGRPDQQAIHGD